MNAEGIETYIDYLLNQVDDTSGEMFVAILLFTWAYGF